MKTYLLPLLAAFIAAPSTAQSQQVVCLYQTVLVKRDMAWCVANGQAWLLETDPSKISPADSVKALQMMLVAAGHNPGPIDGAFGPLTEAAVAEHERRFGLPAGSDREVFMKSLTTQVALRGKAVMEASIASQVSPSPSDTTSGSVRPPAQVVGRVGGAVAEHAAPALKVLGSELKVLGPLLGAAMAAAFLFFLRKR